MDVSLDDLMNASIEAGERVYRCNCKSTCSTKKCVCRANNVDCTDVCTCGTKTKCCKNNKPTPEDSDDEDDEDDISDDDATPGTSTTVPKRKRNRQDLDAPDERQDAHNERIRQQATQIQEFVGGLNLHSLRHICTDLLNRSPGAYADYVSMGDGTDVDAAYQQRQQEEDNPVPSPGRAQALPWCSCGRCRQMPTQVERKCCRPRRGHHCITVTGEFQRLCLDNMVLEIAMRVNEDILADAPVRNQAAYRHSAYRTYIYWQYGRLGAGNRRVIPSCAVWAIRTTWPDPLGAYKGYVEGVGHLGD